MNTYYKGLPVLLFILTVFSRQSAGQIILVQESEQLPPAAEYLGSIKVFGDTYEEIRKEAGRSTLQKGGNIVQQTSLDRPNSHSNAYRFRGDVYYLADIRPIIDKAIRNDDSISKELVPSDADYALVYVYRPYTFYGSLIGYSLRLKDSILCKVKTGSINEIRVFNTGKTTFWAKTELERSIELDLQKGKVYFLRCGIGSGILVGRPELMLVDNVAGWRDVRLMRGEIMKEKKAKIKEDIY